MADVLCSMNGKKIKLKYILYNTLLRYVMEKIQPDNEDALIIYSKIPGLYTKI